jgi:putative transposase
VSKRVSPTESIRAQIDALFDGSRELVEIVEDVARFGAQLIIQSAVEAEVTAFLGRARYERVGGEYSAGSRNGFQPPTTIKTTAGPVMVQRPKLRGTSEPFVSRLFGAAVTKSNALECLVIASFVRGLSVRDVEATLADALGVDGKVSKSEVSRICQAIGDELDAWSSRRLDEVKLDYLFLDGSYFKYHIGAAAEPVLAAWGIDTDGKPVFVGLAATGGGESGDGWADFLTELGERGLACPLLVISDGAAGLIDAVERTMSAALRQRCLIHRCRNITAKVPKHAQADIKADYWKIFDLADDVEPGPDAVALVHKRIDAFAARWRDSYPAAVKCLLTDRDSLTVYLRFPREHWTRVRHSNFIERTFGETRRRVKVIGRLPSETSCLSLVWAVLDRASRGWRGFTMTATGLRLLQDLRRQLLQPPTALRSTTGNAAEQAETVGAVA